MCAIVVHNHDWANQNRLFVWATWIRLFVWANQISLFAMSIIDTREKFPTGYFQMEIENIMFITLSNS